MKKLLITTALIEGCTALGLLAVPALVTRFLLGATLDSPPVLTIARVGGAALIALSLACWLSRENGRPLIGAILLYNVIVIGLLAHAALGLAVSGVGLWPALAFHVAFTIWCMACLWSKRVVQMP